MWFFVAFFAYLIWRGLWIMRRNEAILEAAARQAGISTNMAANTVHWLTDGTTPYPEELEGFPNG